MSNKTWRSGSYILSYLSSSLYQVAILSAYSEPNCTDWIFGICISLRAYSIYTHDFAADHCTKLVRHQFVLPDALWYPTSCVS